MEGKEDNFHVILLTFKINKQNSALKTKFFYYFTKLFFIPYFMSNDLSCDKFLHIDIYYTVERKVDGNFVCLFFT